MTTEQIRTPGRDRPLRLWPGIAAVVALFLVRFVVPALVPGAIVFAMLGGAVTGILVFLWWLIFSRAPMSERIGAVLVATAAIFATKPLLHVSVATAGAGVLFYLYVIPTLGVALVLWAVASRRLSTGSRWATLAAVVVLACGAWTLLRTEGVTGDFESDLAWRWSATPEENLMARAGTGRAPQPASTGSPREPTGVAVRAHDAMAPTTPATTERSEGEPAVSAPGAAGGPTPASDAPPVAVPPAEWAGFRGPARDGRMSGERIATDWSASPPVELWRRPVGPGWSSFAVGAGLLYTQEQRGDDEVVSAYRVDTGEPVWQHQDAARFWESNAGAGPRATPTLYGGRIYTLGATGIVNALDASDGAVVWSRSVTADTGAEIPTWGFAGSPLVVGDLVVVAVAGQLVAYDLASGNPRWVGRAHGGGYSSPELATIAGVPQILLVGGAGLTSVAPADGSELWQYPWSGEPIVQPALVGDADILFSTNGNSGSLGLRRISVTHGPEGWSVTERWISRNLKPYFNDFVVHGDHAFGFDGGILACVDLRDGGRRWKGGRYGYGQLVLLRDRNVLLVLSEQGELALVGATPDAFAELARFPALEGKTWNHPVLAGDVLLVRNDREMAAFRLPRADR